MNDTFNLMRFGYLLKKAILERPMQTVGFTALTLAFTLIVYSFFLYAAGYGQAQNISFIWGLVGGGCLLASVVFGYFSTNAAGSAYLTLPASAFEKWLCGVLITGVFFTGIFLIFYRIVDTSFVTAYHNGLNKNDPAYKMMYDRVYINRFNSFPVRQSITFFLNFAGAMLLGSLYFNRVSVVKVGIAIVCVIAGTFLLNFCVAHLLFNNVDEAIPFNHVFIKVGNEVGKIELPYVYSHLVDISFAYIIPAVLWLTAYIRLREKEI